MTTMSKDIFDRLNKRQQLEDASPKPERTIPRGPLLQPIVPPTHRGSSPSEQLLDFVVNRWPKPAVRAREIMRYGPPAARNRKSAIALAENLAANGWLTPLPPTRQHNERLWAIVRGPSGQ